MNFSLEGISDKLLPQKYKQLAVETVRNREKLIKILLEERKWPEEGWPDDLIEEFIGQLSRLDSNNFRNGCGVGEREGRILCGLVAKRHYYFSHGIGRSGDLNEPQPKAFGGTLLNNLTNSLLLDVIQKIGIKNCRKCLLVPCATGMTLMLCLLNFKMQRPSAKYVIWSRIDQKSCFKCIISAGLVPIIVDTIRDENGDQLVTDVAAFGRQIEVIGAENVVCIYSTTSCFAPRACDNVVELAKIAQKFDVPHLINNAYGLQDSFCAHQIETGSRVGRIDLFVQSTDKNFMVPVGGAIVGAFEAKNIDQLAKTYPGRASSSQCLDVLMTLLSIGETRFKLLLRERKENFQYLKEQIEALILRVGDKLSLRLMNVKDNRISVAVELGSFSKENALEIGSKLFVRHVSGARIVTDTNPITIGNSHFKSWGNHTNCVMPTYLTVAAAIGMKKEEIDSFIVKFEKILKEEIKNQI